MSRISRLYKAIIALDVRSLVIELIIVVVGVLIAVAIDDYLSGQKQQLTVDTYLSNLHADLVEDTLEIQRSSRFYYSKMNSLRQALDTLASPHISEASIEPFLESHLFYIGLENHISFQSQTLDALRETGKFELLQNDSLVQLLFDYNKFCTILINAEAADNRFIRDVIEAYLYEQLPLRRLQPFRQYHPDNNPLVSNETWHGLLSDTQFKNLVLSSIHRAKVSKDYLDRILQKAKVILREIERSSGIDG